MSERVEANLGKLIDETAQRDAIHVAIAPVVAAEDIAPGANIGLTADGLAGTCDTPIGIVDPFLPFFVRKGERFYMVLYPKTITSLRHDWTHPAFASEVSKPNPTKEESELWLRRWITEHDCPPYDEVIAAAVGKPISVIDEDYWPTPYKNDGEYLTFYGRDAHSEIPPEFWDHVENVTGETVPSYKRASSFSCSC